MNQTLTLNSIVMWDPSHKKEIEEAKKEYLKYKKLGHTILKPDGSTMEQFEPSIGQIKILAEKVKKSVLKILNDKGDERIIWSKENGKQAKKAKEQFEELIEKKYKAYSVNTKGKKKTQITEFDVDAEEIIMIPPTSKG
jgi:hypothetical protein